MRTFVVTLVLFPSDERKVVTVKATSATAACVQAELLNPGTLACGADIATA